MMFFGKNDDRSPLLTIISLTILDDINEQFLLEGKKHVLIL